jgi:hypothetical protein
MYVCRTLSYKGAEFDIVEAPLEERMMVKKHTLLSKPPPINAFILFAGKIHTVNVIKRKF